MQPLVKWAGGKRRVLPNTIPYFPASYNRYVEPFLGGGAVFWYLQTQVAKATDTNSDLINLYHTVRDFPDMLIYLLDALATEYNKAPRDTYMSVRASYNQNIGKTDTIQAARFLFLNKTCFNGLYRVNQKGLFNVPFGQREKAPQLYILDNLVGISKYLNQPGITINKQDFKEVLQECGNGDFVYLDPPYIHERGFTSYSAGSFVRKDYEDMVELLHIANQNGAKIVVSNSLDDCKLFHGFKQYIIERSTSISGFTNVRIKSPEYIYCLG